MQKLHEVVSRAKEAQMTYATFRQHQVDKIFKNAALAANMKRLPLAKMAVEETGMGVVEDKVIKNHFASEYIYNKYKNDVTCGTLEYNHTSGIAKVAEPVGIIAGVVPTTNPTSTAIFKSLISLKTRNAIILSPHPRACKSTIEAARTVYEAALDAGAPENIISWIDNPTMQLSQGLMQHPDVSLILATGGPAMVKSAYSSGNPSIGVGAGNTPVIIDDTADIETAVSSILLSKTFDNGVICASEQSVIILESVYDAVKREFYRRGSYFVGDDDLDVVRKSVIVDGRLNANIVGQSVEKLSSMFGLKNVPSSSRVIICEIDRIGTTEPLSYEKLCPILSMYKATSIEEAIAMAGNLVEFGGPGHTSVLYTKHDNVKNIKLFTEHMKTVRVLINTPASQGAIGDLYNFHLDPSLTLGCGTWGSTSVSANVTPKHLLNIKTVTERKENMLWFRVPPKVYFKGGCLEVALRDLAHKKRCFIVTDKPLFDLGICTEVVKILESMGIVHQTFYHVTPDPTLAVIDNGLSEMRDFKPDVIIAIGGGSPMDAAKIMWLLYEHPEIDFESLATRFMDIRKRVYELPRLGDKADLVCIPTTSGTGSEVTPFSVITDDKTGKKYPIADYALTPSMAIIDPQLVMKMPKALTSFGGIDALTHALESYVSVCATDFTRGLSKEAIVLLMKYLPRAYAYGSDDYEAREKVHYAATIAGMAFANAFLGICHSLAHKLGAKFHIPHGLANAALITHVIRYNATDAPMKQAIFPQYTFPRAKQDYADIAHYLDIDGSDAGDKIENLIHKINDLKILCGIPLTLKEIIGGDKEDLYMQSIGDIAEEAFDDQCTGANPRYPLIKDLEAILRHAWNNI